jgi:hypothetical protein
VGAKTNSEGGKDMKVALVSFGYNTEIVFSVEEGLAFAAAVNRGLFVQREYRDGKYTYIPEEQRAISVELIVESQVRPRTESEEYERKILSLKDREEYLTRKVDEEEVCKKALQARVRELEAQIEGGDRTCMVPSTDEQRESLG